MTNSDRFNEAFAHMSHRVMGRRLAKFSLRHRFWLEAMQSPLVFGGEVNLLDMELATRVCAIPYQRLDTALPRLLERGPGWGARLAYLVRAWRRDAGREYLLLQAYLLDHGCPPETWEEPVQVVGPAADGKRESGALPGVLGLVTGLMRGGMTNPDQVWGLSPGEAEWYLAGVFLHRGVDVGLLTAEDEMLRDHLRARKRKRESPEVRDQKPEDGGQKPGEDASR